MSIAFELPFILVMIIWLFDRLNYWFIELACEWLDIPQTHALLM